MFDTTQISANTHQNNPKTFAKNKFAKGNQPKSDKDCGLGVHTASNQHNERTKSNKMSFYSTAILAAFNWVISIEIILILDCRYSSE